MSTIKDYVGVNSLYEFPDGTEIGHREMFGKVVRDIGLKNLKTLVPCKDKETLKAKLAEDEYLNNIPLNWWDKQAYSVGMKLHRLGISSVSLSDCVCTLKEAARQWAEEE